MCTLHNQVVRLPGISAAKINVQGFSMQYFYNSKTKIENNLYLSSEAAITKYHRPGGKQQKFISRSSAGWKSEIKVLAISVHGEGSLPGLLMATLSLCHMVDRKFTRELSPVSSYKDTNSIGSGLHPYDFT